MKLTNEAGDQINIFDTITLPNGGVIYLDADAAKCCQGCGNHYDWKKGLWTSSVYFEQKCEDANVAYENTERKF